MFENDLIKENKYSKTKILSKTINLGKDLDLFISASSKNSGFIDYLFNKILDYTIDRISPNNTYKDFSHSLELINTVLKAWYNNDTNQENDEKMNMVIGILNKKDFLFSNIGKTSCYLVKKDNVVEITDKKDVKKEFSFISNGTLENKDIIIMSSKRLLIYLSESDFIDSYNLNIENFNNSIKQILQEEKIEKNLSINSFMYMKNKKDYESKNLEFIKNFFYKIADTNFIKRVIALYLIILDKFFKKEKLLKSILFIIIITLSIFFLYKIIGSTLNNNNRDKITKNQIIKLEKARIALRIASESISNRDLFELNITKARNIIKVLREKQLFVEQTRLLDNEISKLQKSFNGIESFEETEERKIISLNGSKTIKIIGLNKKIYMIGKNYIFGPIIKGTKTKKYTFNELKNDEFIDATPLINKIVLMTKKGKVILFSTNGNFKNSNVLGQEKWETSNIISSYNSNIYLISKLQNQIFKHKKSGNNFTKGISYLKSIDQKTIKEMVSIAIDGGFYILKKDLKIIKFFANPKYRIENLILNGFPDNYKIEKKNAALKIKTRSNLNYVYILLNNKIYITKPNSRRIQDTKSLNYIGQIEGQRNKIIDFYVKYDGELLVLNKAGIYRVVFEENNGKIMVR